MCLIIFGQRYYDIPPLCILLQGQVLNNIAFAFIVSMSAKCLVIGGFFILLIVTFASISFSFEGSARVLCNSYFFPRNTKTLSFVSIPEVVCYLSTPWFANTSRYYHRPSLESFLQASKTEADQDLRLSGLAVVSRLANARKQVKNTCRQNRSRHA